MPALLEPQTKQHKIVAVAQFKALSDGNGGGEGYPSVFYDLDSSCDIVLPGAYLASLDSFLLDGFIANAHNWDTAIGFPTLALEDGYGLKAAWEFHGTSDAQDARQKAQERANAGKTVKLSIGYVVEDFELVMPEAYAEVLRKYIPADKLDDVMAKAAIMPYVRLLKRIKLYEFSIVTVPALHSAEVTGIKGLAGGVDDALPFAEHLDTTVDIVEGMLTRIKARGEMRKKEGRRHSGTTIERMTGIRDRLQEAHEEVSAMLADAEAEQTSEKTAPPSMAMLKARMQMLSVSNSRCLQSSQRNSHPQ